MVDEDEVDPDPPELGLEPHAVEAVQVPLDVWPGHVYSTAAVGHVSSTASTVDQLMSLSAAQPSGHVAVALRSDPAVNEDIAASFETSVSLYCVARSSKLGMGLYTHVVVVWSQSSGEK